VIRGVILHIENSLPVLVDLEALPEPGDRMVRCTNVRAVDGKRPSYVHDRNGTFFFPLDVIRLIEAPADGTSAGAAGHDEPAMNAAPPRPEPEQEPEPEPDEELEEDLLARIRSI
jgi:hypothetical protein